MSHAVLDTLDAGFLVIENLAEDPEFYLYSSLKAVVSTRSTAEDVVLHLMFYKPRKSPYYLVDFDLTINAPLLECLPAFLKHLQNIVLPNHLSISVVGSSFQLHVNKRPNDLIEKFLQTGQVFHAGGADVNQIKHLCVFSVPFDEKAGVNHAILDFLIRPHLLAIGKFLLTVSKTPEVSSVAQKPDLRYEYVGNTVAEAAAAARGLSSMIPRINIHPDSVDADITVIIKDGEGGSIDFCSVDPWGTHGAAVSRLVDITNTELDAVCQRSMSVEYSKEYINRAGVRILAFSTTGELLGFALATYVSQDATMKRHLICSRKGGVGFRLVEVLHEFVAWMIANNTPVKAILLDSIIPALNFHRKCGYTFYKYYQDQLHLSNLVVPLIDFRNYRRLQGDELEAYKEFLIITLMRGYIKNEKHAPCTVDLNENWPMYSAHELIDKLMKCNEICFLMTHVGPFLGTFFLRDRFSAVLNTVRTVIESPARGSPAVVTHPGVISPFTPGQAAKPRLTPSPLLSRDYGMDSSQGSSATYSVTSPAYRLAASPAARGAVSDSDTISYHSPASPMYDLFSDDSFYSSGTPQFDLDVSVIDLAGTPEKAMKEAFETPRRTRRSPLSGSSGEIFGVDTGDIELLSS